MEGKLPEIYWFAFWVGVVAVSFFMAYLGGRAEHTIRQKALDILKIYAEKGGEPPPAMLDKLTRSTHDRQAPDGPKDGRAALIQGFAGFLFMACVSGGLHYWLVDSDGPRWAVFATQAAMAFFGFGSAGFLLAAVFTREK
jgi:hypothetical protein